MNTKLKSKGSNLFLNIELNSPFGNKVSLNNTFFANKFISNDTTRIIRSASDVDKAMSYLIS